MSAEQPRRKEKTHFVCIKKVPGANNIRMNNLDALCERFSTEVITGPKPTPISYVIE